MIKVSAGAGSERKPTFTRGTIVAIIQQLALLTPFALMLGLGSTGCLNAGPETSTDEAAATAADRAALIARLNARCRSCDDQSEDALLDCASRTVDHILQQAVVTGNATITGTRPAIDQRTRELLGNMIDRAYGTDDTVGRDALKQQLADTPDICIRDFMYIADQAVGRGLSNTNIGGENWGSLEQLDLYRLDTRNPPANGWNGGSTAMLPHRGAGKLPSALPYDHYGPIGLGSEAWVSATGLPPDAAATNLQLMRDLRYFWGSRALCFKRTGDNDSPFEETTCGSDDSYTLYLSNQYHSRQTAYLPDDGVLTPQRRRQQGEAIVLAYQPTAYRKLSVIRSGNRAVRQSVTAWRQLNNVYTDTPAAEPDCLWNPLTEPLRGLRDYSLPSDYTPLGLGSDDHWDASLGDPLDGVNMSLPPGESPLSCESPEDAHEDHDCLHYLNPTYGDCFFEPEGGLAVTNRPDTVPDPDEYHVDYNIRGLRWWRRFGACAGALGLALPVVRACLVTGGLVDALTAAKGFPAGTATCLVVGLGLWAANAYFQCIAEARVPDTLPPWRALYSSPDFLEDMADLGYIQDGVFFVDPDAGSDVLLASYDVEDIRHNVAAFIDESGTVPVAFLPGYTTLEQALDQAEGRAPAESVQADIAVPMRFDDATGAFVAVDGPDGSPVGVSVDGAELDEARAVLWQLHCIEYLERVGHSHDEAVDQCFHLNDSVGALQCFGESLANAGRDESWEEIISACDEHCPGRCVLGPGEVTAPPGQWSVLCDGTGLDAEVQGPGHIGSCSGWYPVRYATSEGGALSMDIIDAGGTLYGQRNLIIAASRPLSSIGTAPDYDWSLVTSGLSSWGGAGWVAASETPVAVPVEELGIEASSLHPNTPGEWYFYRLTYLYNGRYGDVEVVVMAAASDFSALVWEE